ncbi:MAG: thioredoxin family protein [Cellvibrionales bacterium]|nr:thioredoxin family protein [Cellvibrionales bacterium]
MQNLIKHRRRFLREGLLIGLILLGAWAAAKPTNSYLGQRALADTGIDYLPYVAALERAATTGKPLLLQFSALWCGACRRLDRRVFADRAVRDKIQADYIFSRLDWDADRALYTKYGIPGFPVVLIIDPQTGATRRLPATFEPAEFMRYL